MKPLLDGSLVLFRDPEYRSVMGPGIAAVSGDSVTVLFAVGALETWDLKEARIFLEVIA